MRVGALFQLKFGRTLAPRLPQAEHILVGYESKEAAN
jgi:hypothetical protein